MSSQTNPSNHLTKAIGWGAISLTLYLLLFTFETQIVDWASRGKWFFMVPILIAFAFSFVHGKFTAEFWESLGFRAKQ